MTEQELIDLRVEAQMDYEREQRQQLYNDYKEWLYAYNETEDNYPFDLWIKDLTY